MEIEKSYKCPHCYQWSTATDWDSKTQVYYETPIFSFYCPQCNTISDISEILDDNTEFFGTVEKIEPVGYCPWCDEPLVEDPVCPNCGDTAGLKQHWYELGNIYPMEKCIYDLYTELREQMKYTSSSLTMEINEIFKEHEIVIKKSIEDCTK